MDTTTAATLLSLSTAGWAMTAGAAAHLAQRLRTDPLTGLPNREALAALTRRAGHQRRDWTGGSGVGLLLIDLDRFKAINDTHGHATGDDVLKATAARLATIAGPGEVPIRLHGDEFALWLGRLPGTSVDDRHITARAHAVHTALAQPITPPTSSAPGQPARRLVVTASVGAAALPAAGLSVAALLCAADQAMYQAKRARYRAVPLATRAPATATLGEDTA